MSDTRSAIAARFSSDVHGTTAISPSLTMVGYGDHYPVTAAWRLVACRLMIPAFEQSARMSTSPVPTHVSLRSCCQGTTKEGEWADTFSGMAAPQDVVAALEAGADDVRAKGRRRDPDHL